MITAAMIAAAEKKGYARAVSIVRAAFETARAEPRPESITVALSRGDRKVPGVALDTASRAGRITALGAVLEQLERAA